jgi:hypothetical protein
LDQVAQVVFILPTHPMALIQFLAPLLLQAGVQVLAMILAVLLVVLEAVGAIKAQAVLELLVKEILAVKRLSLLLLM